MVINSLCYKFDTNYLKYCDFENQLDLHATPINYLQNMQIVIVFVGIHVITIISPYEPFKDSCYG